MNAESKKKFLFCFSYSKFIVPHSSFVFSVPLCLCGYFSDSSCPQLATRRERVLDFASVFVSSAPNVARF